MEGIINWVKEHVGWSLLIGFLVIALIVESCSGNDSSARPLDGYSQYKVAISVRMETNTGVGNDFEWQFRVNNTIVNSGSVINAQTPLSCFAKVVERDSYRYPDVGMETVTIYPHQTNEAMVIVRVDEYGGVSNSGTFATFVVWFTFTGV